MYVFNWGQGRIYINVIDIIVFYTTLSVGRCSNLDWQQGAASSPVLKLGQPVGIQARERVWNRLWF